MKNINRGKHKATAAPATQQDGEKEKENTAAAVNVRTPTKLLVGWERGRRREGRRVTWLRGTERRRRSRAGAGGRGEVKSDLEKRVAKRFGSGFSWVKISGELKGTSLTLTAGTKEKQLELAGCMVSPSDAAPKRPGTVQSQGAEAVGISSGEPGTEGEMGGAAAEGH